MHPFCKGTEGAIQIASNIYQLFHVLNSLLFPQCDQMRFLCNPYIMIVFLNSITNATATNHFGQNFTNPSMRNKWVYPLCMGHIENVGLVQSHHIGATV